MKLGEGLRKVLTNFKMPDANREYALREGYEHYIEETGPETDPTFWSHMTNVDRERIKRAEPPKTP